MTRFPILPTAVALMMLSSPSWACASREAAIAAIQSQDYVQAAVLYETVEVSCDDVFRDWMGEALAGHTFRQAMAADGDLDAQQALFRQSLVYYPHWRTHVALADIEAARGNRALEAQQLQVALNRISDGPVQHTADEAEIAALFERTANALLLAGTVVDAPSLRSGESGGVFAANVRGFKVQEVPLPITFAHDSTVFTDVGAAYADKLLKHLLTSNPAQVVLIGHTDPTGSASYNQDLSLRRAEALRNYLASNGYPGAIDVEGRGESEVPVPPDNIAEGSEEHYMLARRVVLRRP